MADLLVIAGSPGSGKTTVGDLLHAELGSPFIDFGRIREFHLDPEWKNESPAEEEMSFENLTYIVGNYVRHGWKNVIVTDLKDFRVVQMPETFSGLNFLIATLVVESDEEIAHRVRTRNEGWRDVEGAIDWNRRVRNREEVKGEYKIDNSHRDPRKTAAAILKLLDKEDER